MGWMTGVQFLAGAVMVYLLFATMSRLALEPTELLVQWVSTWYYYPRCKVAGTWSWPCASSAKVKNAWSYISPFLSSWYGSLSKRWIFMAWYLVKHGDNFAIIFHLLLGIHHFKKWSCRTCIFYVILFWEGGEHCLWANW